MNKGDIYIRNDKGSKVIVHTFDDNHVVYSFLRIHSLHRETIRREVFEMIYSKDVN